MFDGATPASEVIDPCGQQSVEQSTADPTPAVGAVPVRPGHLRNHLAAERALPQIGAHWLTAVHALSGGIGRAWRGIHCGSGSPFLSVGLKGICRQGGFSRKGTTNRARNGSCANPDDEWGLSKQKAATLSLHSLAIAR